MQVVKVDDVVGHVVDRFVARPLIEGDQSQVRVIRLAPGQALPPHRHGRSDVMVYVAAGSAGLETPEGHVAFEAGSLAFLRGDEELRVDNPSATEVTLIAFFAPKLGAG